MIIIHSFSAFPYAIPCAILMVIGIIIATISITSTFMWNKDDKYINLTTTGVCLGIALTIFPIPIGVMSETRHQILIDNNTSVVEVQQKYEIIGQKGISYIVKDIDT